MTDPMTEEQKTGREWQWQFSDVEVTTVNGMTDVVKKLTINLWLIDYDLDMRQGNGFPCHFGDPDPDSFVQYEDLTPELLKEWALNYYANPERGWPHGKTRWLETQKQKLVDMLEQRAATQKRIIKATITES